ncbi:succinate dehydrogenase subunit C [Desulfacinum infernum DSM 9756]|uniref:Succinate dehydrogenase cytochrome b556 subunit n=1 Tax=Desulfacinum infernum DSM 9756 TaxID=1121391 RepID=A0A1M4UG60_9BACT|nr:succinate dehydrogenase, cytochrome b556 subunit [Desulfacinum infernum]SHE55618.1 succinate dehydrogenase subunit C [Desulfacinum infernum DSM 9756]
MKKVVFQPKVRYKLHPGYLAWILHRATGVLLGLYLFLHIWVIHHLSQGEQAFNEVMAVVQSPLFHLLEIGLLGTVVYHGLNGLRVVLIDYGNLGKREIMQKAVFAVFAVSAILILAGAIPMLRLAFGI